MAMKKYYGMSRTTCNRLVAYGVPLALLLAVAYLGPVSRDLDVVELFSGGGALHKSCREAGLDAQGFEVLSNPDDDLSTTAGFLRGIRLILRLRINGSVWSGQPCSSWVFLSRSVSQRTATSPSGDDYNPWVRTHNVLASRCALLFLLAMARSATWCCEQPASSLLDRYHRMRQIRHLCSCWFKMQVGVQSIIFHGPVCERSPMHCI